MRDLLRDPGLAREMGDLARDIALERFSIDRFVRDWDEAFAEVTAGHGRTITRVHADCGRLADDPANRLISEHASPLATLGGVDAGGQNVYVDQVARGLAAMGHEVDVFTRRDAPGPAGIACRWRRASASSTCPPAGRRRSRRRTCFLTCRRSRLGWRGSWRGSRPGTTWSTRTSSCPASSRPSSRRGLGLPFVVTFHALGRVRRQYQARRRPLPRGAVRDRGPGRQRGRPDHRRVPAGRRGPDPALSRRPVPGSRSSPAASIRTSSGRSSQRRGAARARARSQRSGSSSSSAGWCRARAWTTSSAAVGVLARDHDVRARLLVVGGRDREPDPARTPEIGRLASDR